MGAVHAWVKIRDLELDPNPDHSAVDERVAKGLSAVVATRRLRGDCRRELFGQEVQQAGNDAAEGRAAGGNGDRSDGETKVYRKTEFVAK